MSGNRVIWISVGFVVGVLCGFVLGVFSVKEARAFLGDMVTSERPADVSDPTFLDRPGFSLEYPSNWSVDTAADDYEPDHCFSIDSPGSCFVGFIVFEPAIDMAEAVEDIAGEYRATLIKNPEESAFDSWGALTGTGVHLQGRILSLAPGGARVFATTTESSTLVVYEVYYDEDLPMVGPAFELVRSSFRFKE